MKDYTELVKKLRSGCETCKLWDGYRCCLDGDCTAKTRLQAADAIEELVATVERIQYLHINGHSRWIPVTERLPEDENKKYLIAMSSVTKPTTTLYDICWFAKDLYKVDRFDFPDEKNKPGFYKYDSEYGNYIISDITHWMPLPEKP